MVNTPVLYITFARPEYASQSFAAIKKAQPKKLYFYSNKARNDRLDEVKRNEEVRSYVKQIDWDCEVVTWFRDEYVDIYTSLWGAMDWLFDNEEQGIVLEEDCVASLPFFDYCDNMLRLYKDDKRVSIISGNNRTPQYNPKNVNHFITCHVDIYGWASWQDRWKVLDREMKDWPKYKHHMHQYYGNWLTAIWTRFWWQRMYKRLDFFFPWDSIFSYNRVKNRSYGLIPVGNLVADIGTVGVHHGILFKDDGKLQYDVVDVGDIYSSPTKQRLILDRKYENKHSYAIIARDIKYMWYKLISYIKIKKNN